MAVAIITQDGKRVGIVETEPQGVGVIAWFHRNAGGQSADYYLTHGGYAVEEGEPDCREVEALINAICERAGVTMSATFVPFSQSRNAAPGPGRDKPWRSLNWRVSIQRRGREIVSTDYAQGEGHAPASKKTAAEKETAARVMGCPVKVALRQMLDHEIETGRVAKGHHWSSGVSGGKPIPAPSIGDVLQSLALDASALDYPGFEAWAAEFGYDADSRSAEASYRDCIEIATKLRAGLGADLLAEIQLAARFN